MPPHLPDECNVRHVQPYEATKFYVCPFCTHTIEIGQGHEVVVPHADVDDRRHFHSGCWNKYVLQYEKAQ
jgi:hypothetical protein